MRRRNDTSALYLLAALPCLFWSGPINTANVLRKAGIDTFTAPPVQAEKWKTQKGFKVAALSETELKARIELTAPGVNRRVMVASATTAPWVDANGWLFRRSPGKDFFGDIREGRAAVAAAEAFAYDAKATFRVQASDLASFGEMLNFLRSVPESKLPEIADFGFIDDGSDSAAEILNLLTRRNLLYRIVKAPDPSLKLNVAANADDPHLFAAKVREKMTDDQRSLRVYGSEVVLCRLQGDADHMRVHVLNYGRNPLDGVRLRVRGTFSRAKLYSLGSAKPPQEWAESDGFTEFSIPELGAYAVVDLLR